MAEHTYYQHSVRDLERDFGVSSAKGLSLRQVCSLLKKHGLNSLDKIKAANAWLVLGRQFANYFIVLLMAAAGIAFFLEGVWQTLILLIIVAINILVGFFQEYKAEQALSDLKSTYSSKSKVWREGGLHIVSNEGLVPGDIVIIEAGDRIPADLRVVRSESLLLDESVLTGESVPVAKNAEILLKEAALAEQTNMLFASTTVVGGRGRGLVVATGVKTEFGRLAQLVVKLDEKTPLEKEINYLSRIFTLVSIVLTLVVFTVGYLRNFEIVGLLNLTIALFVAAVPESLPTVITLALAIGMVRMTEKKAIVRRLGVVEALGAVNIIVTDKTGTLTDNRLSVGAVAFLHQGVMRRFLVDRDTEIIPAMMTEKISQVLFCGLLCSNVTRAAKGDFLGDPIEVAIADRALEFNRQIFTKAKHFRQNLEIPFDSTRKYMAVITKNDIKSELIVKGAAEIVIKFTNLSPQDKKEVLKESLHLSRSGYKVIAVIKKDSSTGMKLEKLEFEGLIAVADEPSPGVKEALLQTLEAGIRPIIVTGDHPETAVHVANQLGLHVQKNEVLLGAKISGLKPAEMRKVLSSIKIIARATPLDKLRIVSALQKKGNIVAVTGDGVNDAPALKEATVGIAMGVKGTDVARDSADIVLTDDHYSTIVSAVEYGRTVYDNIRNAIIFLLAGNFNELFLIILAFLANLPVPFFTIQILWINMITDSLPALAFAFEKPTAKTLDSRPRSDFISSLRAPLKHAFLLGLVAFGLSSFLYLWGLGRSVEIARTLVFLFAVSSEMVFALSIRSKWKIWQRPKSFLENRFLIRTIIFSILLQLILFLPPLSSLFKITAPSLDEAALLVLCTLAAFLAAEIAKGFFASPGYTGAKQFKVKHLADAPLS